jgi:GNAT superfamily N-acetyltransferase
VTVDLDGPVTRITGYGPGGWVEYHDLGGLAGAALDDLIARQIAFFAERGIGFEWKLHGHDLPVDLPDRPRAAGFVPEDQETVVIAPIDRLPLESAAQAGVVVRELEEREDYRRIADLEAAVWGEKDTRGWIDSLAAERDADPDGVAIFLALADDVAVSAGWIRFPTGTEFGTLWGGSTLAEWRGRGIYRSLVARRAKLAAQRGCRYLEVDASDDSRPILVRLGFVPVTTTTPYIWKPAS